MSFMNIFKPFISEQDQRLIESIKSMKTIRPVGRGVAINAEDVVETMFQLQTQFKLSHPHLKPELY
jgi:hypothetical protein